MSSQTNTIIYNLDGTFTKIPSDKPFFRKMSNNHREKTICQLLMRNPHKNIVKIYEITSSYIDMELLSTDLNGVDASSVMADVKTFLQGLGIMYIDWKPDNIGIDANGTLKLFDFDVSGLIDTVFSVWILEPPKFWLYNKAVDNGCINPVDIDNYAFLHICGDL